MVSCVSEELKKSFLPFRLHGGFDYKLCAVTVIASVQYDVKG